MIFYAYIFSLNFISSQNLQCYRKHMQKIWEGRNLRRAADVDAGHELGFTRQEVWTIGQPVKLLFGNCLCLENFHLSVQMLGALAWASYFSSFLCLKILDFKPYLFSTSTFDTAKPLFPTGAGPAHKQVWNPGSHRSCVCEGS